MSSLSALVELVRSVLGVFNGRVALRSPSAPAAENLFLLFARVRAAIAIEITDVTVNSGAVVDVSVQLEIGAAAEVVEVRSAAVTVDTNRQTVDTVIE